MSHLLEQCGKRLRFVSIGGKLILTGYLIMAPILFFISMLIGVNNYWILTERTKEQALQNTRSINEGIRLLQGVMEDICVYISINTDIEHLLKASDISELNEDSQIWTHEAPMKMLENMAAIKSYIKTIAVYPENGLRPYLRCFDDTSHVFTIEELRESEIYQMAINKRGKMGWIAIDKYGNNLYQQNWKDKVVLFREIYNLSRKQCLGFLAIGADKEYFEELCSKTIDTENEGMVVLSADSGILVQVGQVPENISKYLVTEEYLVNEEEVCDYEDSRIYRVENKKEGIFVCQIEEKISLQRILIQTMAEPVLLLVGFLVGLFPIFFFISRVVTAPLGHLQNAMVQFQKGDFNQKIEVVSHDEVGQVMRCFNDMVDEIRELVNKNYIMALKEKESELLALQAQINPHFLYNTLDALYWQAQNLGDDELSEDILALANLFRMVLGQGKAIVTVREEMDLIREYLHVQKMRFEKWLEYEILVDKDIENAWMPKLMLQPFVENSIVHGFEKKMEGCKITVRGCREGNYLKFAIIDTGAGMSKEQIAAIFEEDVKKRYSGQRVGRYAVKNVKERLELKYHEDFVLEITSDIGKGTQVLLKIPYEEGLK